MSPRRTCRPVRRMPERQRAIMSAKSERQFPRLTSRYKSFPRNIDSLEPLRISYMSSSSAPRAARYPKSESAASATKSRGACHQQRAPPKYHLLPLRLTSRCLTDSHFPVDVFDQRPNPCADSTTAISLPSTLPAKSTLLIGPVLTTISPTRLALLSYSQMTLTSPHQRYICPEGETAV
jgi:hypothetical protein